MNENKKNISIIMVVHDQGHLLEQNLPQFMDVAIETDSEVIIVDDASTDDTPDVLKRIKSTYPTLYTTFLPRSVVINPNHQRLGYTIGIKAAHSDCLVLADISRPPLSAEWLRGLNTDGCETVLVYSGRKDGSITHQSMIQLEEAKPFIRKAERRSGRGHHGKWLKFRRGLYDAVSIRKDRIYDAIRYFDQPVNGRKLIGLRFHIFFKNLF